MNVELHLHTDAYYNGIGDGAQTVVQAIDVAAKNNATAIAITDHGNCANWTDFFAYANGEEVDHQTLAKKGLKSVKPILGKENYVKKEEKLIRKEVLSDELLSLYGKYVSDDDINIVNQHLILLAKDYQGVQAISRLTSEENRLIKAKERPVATFEMLKEYLAGGHVVCSSACIAGVIANPLLFNSRIDREIAKIDRRIAKSEETLGQEYFSAKEKVEKITTEIESMNEEISSLTDVAKKKYGKAKAAIKKEPEEKRDVLYKALDVEIIETEKAKERIALLKSEIKELKASISNDKKILTKAKNRVSTIEQNLSLIKLLEASKKTDDEMFLDACQAANEYKSLFGDDFYIELQYHHIAAEAYVMPLLVKVAKECDIKCIITNDVHVDTKENLSVREYIRNCASIKRPWVDAIPGDEELYFKTDDEKKAILNVEKIASECNVTKLSEENHYPQFKDADEKLKELALSGKTDVELLDGRTVSIFSKSAGIKARYGNSWNDDLQKRFDYEMGVISQMGFSSYFLFIADVIIKCKEARVNATDIGPGRGSGAGSIVCYLAAITELDPIEHGLLFERFLNPERVSMPEKSGV